jgi:hypothetical protein
VRWREKKNTVAARPTFCSSFHKCMKWMYKQHAVIYRNITFETIRVLAVKLYNMLYTTHGVVQLVETLPYKPDGRWFDSLCFTRNFPCIVLLAALWPRDQISL